MTRPLVYVAGPLTDGGRITDHAAVEANVNRASEAGDEIERRGGSAIIPHLTYYWHRHRPHPWSWWLARDRRILARCDALFRLPGESKGADLEERWARERGIPVFRDLLALEGWARWWEARRGPSS